ncbi:MAG: tRNA 2-thiouridine(34) synthase MnmA [Nitrospinae bacterium]|nr:tRNA 2-thiouridine(34) synthase MnmA [Nitrospinota bacterium]
MSGGVDSSVTAALLKDAGHRLIGVTMKVWDAPEEVERRHGACCSLDDAEDARRVAERLGIPHYTLNTQNEFKEKVVDYFVSEYLKGRTPNPCVLCNSEVKFDYLFKKGASFGAELVATGHYARIGEFMGRKVILRGHDDTKDQSYFLFSIKPERLDSILFPLGGYSKTQVRAMADKYALPVAQKQESQEICFIPDNDYGRFIRSLPEGKNTPSGDIVDDTGKKIGVHKGYPFYTVGQRRGLGIGHSERLYVTAIEPERNRIVVGHKDSIYGKALLARGMNWFVPPQELAGLALTARIRHQGKDAPAQVTPGENNSATVEFESPQMSITPGQAVVLYHEDALLGGGWIEKKV